MCGINHQPGSPLYPLEGIALLTLDAEASAEDDRIELSQPYGLTWIQIRPLTIRMSSIQFDVS